MSCTVAYLGPQGTFTEAALIRFAELGCIPGGTAELQLLAVTSPAEAIGAVLNPTNPSQQPPTRADYAVVAIENSVDGPVTPTFDALAAHPGAQIYHEIDIDVAFAIMVRTGRRLGDIRTFTTHPVAKPQVAQWLERNLPDATFIAATSNAAAAQMVAEGKADAAAAPLRAADIYHLDVIEHPVADVAGARTRFALIGPAGVPTPRTGNDRTSIMVTLPNEAGTLVGALQELATRGVDMSRIESRPTRTGLGTYRFHIDIVGHIDDTPVAEALRAIYLRAEKVEYLGSWPSCEQLRSPINLEEIHRAHEWTDNLRAGTR